MRIANNNTNTNNSKKVKIYIFILILIIVKKWNYISKGLQSEVKRCIGSIVNIDWLKIINFKKEITFIKHI